MRLLICIFLAVPALGVCRIDTALTTLRPGAEWFLDGEDYRDLRWIDKTQTKPTEKEITTAIDACMTAERDAEASRIAAKAIVTDESKTEAQRFDALVEYLGIK